MRGLCSTDWEARAMRLTSSAFASDGWIPRRFTCEGADESPPLAWSNVPAAARGFALVLSDPDAPGRTWYHWAVWDIPSQVRFLPLGVPAGQHGLLQGTNDFRRPGYGGPCPPRGMSPHRYQFRLYALDVERLGLASGARCQDVEAGARARAIETAELVGVFGRSR
jgi:Raf kinase inhibitor-like YbhB/YbcL family protein